MSKRFGWALIIIGVVIMVISLAGGIAAIWTVGPDARKLAATISVVGFAGFAVMMVGIANEPWGGK